jgi:hypothetical protein
MFIETIFTMGDSEAMAVKTCQEIVNDYMTKNGCPKWKVLRPLLRGVLIQVKKCVRKYSTNT